MYGHYTKDLGDYAKKEAKKAKEKSKEEAGAGFQIYKHERCAACKRMYHKR